MGIFRDKIDRIEKNKKGYGDKILVWAHSTGWPIDRDDLETFCDHMDAWYSICGSTLSRSEYEELCKKFSIDSVSDDDIVRCGCEYGNFGMDHYHTVPEYRLSGIIGELTQGRWRGMRIENPNIVAERESADEIRREDERLEALRSSYPDDLDSWILAIGGVSAIYDKMVKLHSSNSHQLRDEDRHFEWLIGHSSMDVGMSQSKKHPDYKSPVHGSGGVYPFYPDWWGGWSETDSQHPINRIAVLLSDHKDEFEPYRGKIAYVGYGEDCGDDVRRNAQEWLG